MGRTQSFWADGAVPELTDVSDSLGLNQARRVQKGSWSEKSLILLGPPEFHSLCLVAPVGAFQ